jgi:TetR/AcrR family transcriptional regulator, transcriptional repressor of aconitase
VPVPKVSAAHLEARRAQILDGARACFARWGFQGTTVARLEEEIGLSRGAIFHYFPSKWELFWELATSDQSRALEAFVDGGLEAMLGVFFEGDPAWLGVYFEASGILARDPELFEKWIKRTPDLQGRAQERLERMQRDGEIRDDVPLSEISRFVGIVADGLVMRRAFDLELDRDTLVRLVRDALAPRE